MTVNRKEQAGILPPPQAFARYLTGQVTASASSVQIRETLLSLDLDGLVVGVGPGLAKALGIDPPGLRPFPEIRGPDNTIPAGQRDIWVWVAGASAGDVVIHARKVTNALQNAFVLDPPVDGFKFGEGAEGRGLDLTGYEDGTENPVGEDAVNAALAADGSSIVAVQPWRHDLTRFGDYPDSECDNIIGRRRSDNEELADAPVSAHVKRTAQEDFEPEAFILRRSLPWAGPGGEGLMFVAFGFSADAFEAQMRRMAGEEDGITDALFRFSTPMGGGYYWCPPVSGSNLFID